MAGYVGTKSVILSTDAAKVGGDANVTGTVTAASFVGDGSALTGLPAGYTNGDVDTHVNTSTATSGQYLGWNGSDYAWSAIDFSTPPLPAGNLTGSLPAIDGSALTGISSTPASTVIYVAQNTAPTGYLKANGATVSRTTYADLFAAVGTTFGSGDGSTTFGLPDLRGEFLRGWDDARGIDSGRSFGSAQADELGSHRHISPTILGDSKTNSASAGVRLSNNEMTSSGAEGDEYNRYTENTGGTETRPRNIALLACIKY